jgi:Spy/CpxP family protein refolding chaperone
MGGMGMGGMRMMEWLDLTADQKQKVVDVLTENVRARLLSRMELADARKTLRELGKADAPDPAALIAAHQAVGAATGKLEVLNLTMKDNLKAVLTPDQQKKLDDFRQKFRRNWDRDRDDDDDRDDRD